MDGDLSSDHVIAELVEMGFEFSNITEAVRVVGPSLEAAVDFLLNGPRRNSNNTASSSKSSTSRVKPLRQSTFKAPEQSIKKRIKTSSEFEAGVSETQFIIPNPSQEPGCDIGSTSQEKDDIFPDWELKATNLLRKHFGYSSLKSFQKEALTAWSAHHDCLVLAATGSGKSLCFQIPALLTGKVVVVISPLISLMHDQCIKLAKHGVSACFLGSGQPDSRIEGEAMGGTYSIIYVCPETLIRLIEPLQNLAQIRGIALFAIDEVHCVSKWGHDFRADYRRLSILRKHFNSKTLQFLKFDIPIMALTATATIRVREDIMKSLQLTKETKIVLTSFFRPNLVFSVKHSFTRKKPYVEDFEELINIYSGSNLLDIQKHDLDRFSDFSDSGMFEADEISLDDPKDDIMSVEFLEDESDVLESVDDFDVSCGGFFGRLSEKFDSSTKTEGIIKLGQDHTQVGLTIIYAPTRKETESISKFLCNAGVKAAPYHARLPKSHLRRVHKEFHENALEVVVATIAFGMGIDKLNVRRIIHYGWPQSLEAYYQEAGRAGRDGKLASCILYANLLATPSLLPSKRNEEQTRQAYKMLSDCFRYGMNRSSCRAKVLVEYFGEQFNYEKCQMCDVCKNGPPDLLNLKAEAVAFMDAISSHYGETSSASSSLYDHASAMFHDRRRLMDKPSVDNIASRIRGNFPESVTAGKLLWWRGFARILEEKGFIKEIDEKVHVQIKYPELTECGLIFLKRKGDKAFDVYPEADMILEKNMPYCSFSEWGKGWADPVIRRQRLNAIRGRRNIHIGRSHNSGVRNRLANKLSKRKR